MSSDQPPKGHAGHKPEIQNPGSTARNKATLRAEGSEATSAARMSRYMSLAAAFRDAQDHAPLVETPSATPGHHSVVIVLKFGTGNHAAQDGKTGPVPSCCHHTTCLVQGP